MSRPNKHGASEWNYKLYLAAARVRNARSELAAAERAYEAARSAAEAVVAE